MPEITKETALPAFWQEVFKAASNHGLLTVKAEVNQPDHATVTYFWAKFAENRKGRKSHIAIYGSSSDVSDIYLEVAAKGKKVIEANCREDQAIEKLESFVRNLPLLEQLHNFRAGFVGLKK